MYFENLLVMHIGRPRYLNKILGVKNSTYTPKNTVVLMSEMTFAQPFFLLLKNEQYLSFFFFSFFLSFRLMMAQAEIDFEF